MKLPVFTVASTVAPAEHLQALGERLLPRQDKQLTECGATVALRSPTGSIEVDTSRGGTWAAEHSQLWKFDPGSTQHRDLIAPADAQKL
ncbi:MAG: hypothetical protein JWN04_4622, partial [Myxococcaceae bacterium]|nr:hypothetical protein [Myxococcaceae bacterium]